MKYYSPTGRRNRGRPLKRLPDTWDRNGSTSVPTPWQIYDDDDDICKMHGTHSFKMCISPVLHPTPPALDLLFVVSRSHTIRHTRTPGLTSLDEWSARLRGRYPHNTQRTQKTHFHALSAIRTRNPTRQTAADVRLRPHGYRDQLNLCM